MQLLNLDAGGGASTTGFFTLDYQLTGEPPVYQIDLDTAFWNMLNAPRDGSGADWIKHNPVSQFFKQLLLEMARSSPGLGGGDSSGITLGSGSSGLDFKDLPDEDGDGWPDLLDLDADGDHVPDFLENWANNVVNNILPDDLKDLTGNAGIIVLVVVALMMILIIRK